MKTKFSLFLLVLVILISCNNQDPKGYLSKVLNNLDKIESATYYTIHEAWQPGDTAALFINRIFNKEYNNPMDSTIGASFVTLDGNDTTQFEFGYDETIRVLTYHDVKKNSDRQFHSQTITIQTCNSPIFQLY